MNIFYNNQAQEYYESLDGEISKLKSIDNDLLVSYCNLLTQEYKLQAIVLEEGFSVTNVNSRGGSVSQVNPNYKAYLSCVAQKNTIHTKLKKMINSLSEVTTDGFDEF